MPETAKRCPMMEFETAGGPDYTRTDFDVAEFQRQCREVEVDAANVILNPTPVAVATAPDVAMSELRQNALQAIGEAKKPLRSHEDIAAAAGYPSCNSNFR